MCVFVNWQVSEYFCTLRQLVGSAAAVIRYMYIVTNDNTDSESATVRSTEFWTGLHNDKLPESWEIAS